MVVLSKEGSDDRIAIIDDVPRRGVEATLYLKRSGIRRRACDPAANGLLALVAALVVATASCGGGGEEDDAVAPTAPPAAAGRTFTTADLSKFGVQSADLPPGYRQGTSGELPPDECLEGAPPSLLPQLQSFGFERCYASNFSKKSGDFTNDFGSGAMLFRDAAGASRALPVLRDVLSESFRATGEADAGSSRDVAASGLGDETPPGVSFNAELFGRDFDVVLYVWRKGNVIAFIGGSDVLNDMNAQSMLGIAEKIDSRSGG